MKTKNILRVFNNKDLSIRNGKFGNYLYYKDKQKQKPDFISLKKFKGNYLQCEEKEILDYIISRGKK